MRVTCPFVCTRDYFTGPFHHFTTDFDTEIAGMTSSRRTPSRRKLNKEMVQEVHPGTSIARRDERIRSVAKSFEEITEGEEEEDMSPSTSTSPTSRSPYALPPSECSPFNQRKSVSATSHHPLVSPKLSRRMFPPRLQRGFSDPIVRRKSSLPSYPFEMYRESGSLETLASDLLCLPPIPEAATPASPSSQHTGFKEVADSS